MLIFRSRQFSSNKEDIVIKIINPIDNTINYIKTTSSDIPIGGELINNKLDKVKRKFINPFKYKNIKLE